jgi:hypothetical protein
MQRGTCFIIETVLLDKIFYGKIKRRVAVAERKYKYACNKNQRGNSSIHFN